PAIFLVVAGEIVFGGRVKMHLRLPELRIGQVIYRNCLSVYPLYPAQRLLFPDAFPVPKFMVATPAHRAKARASDGGRGNKPTLPMLTNDGDIPVLYLPGDGVAGA